MKKGGEIFFKFQFKTKVFAGVSKIYRSLFSREEYSSLYTVPVPSHTNTHTLTHTQHGRCNFRVLGHFVQDLINITSSDQQNQSGIRCSLIHLLRMFLLWKRIQISKVIEHRSVAMRSFKNTFWTAVRLQKQNSFLYFLIFQFSENISLSLKS